MFGNEWFLFAAAGGVFQPFSSLRERRLLAGTGLTMTETSTTWNMWLTTITINTDKNFEGDSI